jgi:hypothetical protein
MRVLSILLLVVCQSLLGCSGWQEFKLEEYQPQHWPTVNDPLRVTCVDGTVHYGRMQPQSTRENLILESREQDPSVLLTIPLSKIRRMEFFRPIY